MSKVSDYLKAYNISPRSEKKLEGYASHNYKIDTAEDQTYLLKIYEPNQSLDLIQAESKLIDHFAHKIDLQFTQAILNEQGDEITQLEDGKFCRLLKYVEGKFLTKDDLTEINLIHLGETIALMHQNAPEEALHALKSRVISWDLKQINSLGDYVDFIENPRDKHKVLFLYDAFVNHVQPIIHKLESGYIHNDLNEQNLIVNSGKLTGIIDFGDAVYAPFVFDLGICLCYLLMLHEDVEMVTETILKAYAKHRQLSKEEIDALYYIIGARLYTSVVHSSKEKTAATDTEYILSSEKNAWQLIHKWLKVSPVNFAKLGYKIFNIHVSAYDSKVIIDKREKFISPSLSTSYSSPIHFNSAAFQYMYDQYGNTYLDAYNNIPMLGHSHPRISIAISQQVRKLYTNTRYHYEVLGRYAEKLIKLCPSHLTRVIFVNSGSAASDLAVRIARTFTGNYNVGVIDQGYHGNTNLGIEISPYKYGGKGGSGKADYILNLPLIYQENIDSNNQVVDILNVLSEPLAGIIAESISGCGGQLPMHKGYMKTLESYCHKNGIPLIIDEVQTGFGRVGTNFWAHEQQDIKPDILVLGKPMGNGHPLAAVVMTEELSEAFNNGMEFFSSFGGNPVSCLVGETVLDVIKEEGLQQNALEVGSFFLKLLEEVRSVHPEIKDVRGTGLFLGVELSEADKQGTKLAKYVKEYLKANFVLTSTDGKYDNVLKIKPPLCFEKTNAEKYCTLLAEALEAYKEEK